MAHCRSKPSKGFGQQAPAAGKEEVPKAKASKGETDRWQLEVAGKEEWLQWLAQQRREAAAEGDTVYVQVCSHSHSHRCAYVHRVVHGPTNCQFMLSVICPTLWMLRCMAKQAV